MLRYLQLVKPPTPKILDTLIYILLCLLTGISAIPMSILEAVRKLGIPALGGKLVSFEKVPILKFSDNFSKKQDAKAICFYRFHQSHAKSAVSMCALQLPPPATIRRRGVQCNLDSPVSLANREEEH